MQLCAIKYEDTLELFLNPKNQQNENFERFDDEVCNVQKVKLLIHFENLKIKIF
jgi:hypothetical protein